jgi:hypothetical protein
VIKAGMASGTVRRLPTRPSARALTACGLAEFASPTPSIEGDYPTKPQQFRKKCSLRVALALCRTCQHTRAHGLPNVAGMERLPPWYIPQPTNMLVLKLRSPRHCRTASCGKGVKEQFLKRREVTEEGSSPRTLP